MSTLKEKNLQRSKFFYLRIEAPLKRRANIKMVVVYKIVSPECVPSYRNNKFRIWLCVFFAHTSLKQRCSDDKNTT